VEAILERNPNAFRPKIQANVRRESLRALGSRSQNLKFLERGQRRRRPTRSGIRTLSA
jgi:hypothetical protein